MNQKPYIIMYNPLTFELMDFIGQKSFTVLDMLGYFSGKDGSGLNADNYLDYLDFDLSNERIGLTEIIGFENYSTYYISNQIARADSGMKIVIADGKRRKIADIIREKGYKPYAVFMTSISSTFPTAVAVSVALNYAGIPVVIGGIHVSTSYDDVSVFIRQNVPNPELVAEVRGPGDSIVIASILRDLKNNALKPEYSGSVPVENGVWGSRNVETLPDVNIDFFKNLPLVGSYLAKVARIQVATPYLGCPFSCSFCSISALSGSQKRFTVRSAEDFIREIESHQETGHLLKSRFFIFLPDNLLLGGKRLEEMLDYMIEKRVKINYGVQISIDIADQPRLLEKLRLSGASFLFIGLESLDIRDLEHIQKNSVPAIRKSGLSVEAYYAEKIRILQSYGMVVNGAFIFGLPHNYFNSLSDNSGTHVADFCVRNKIGIQATCLNDLPGSQNFKESQAGETYMYGKQGTMDYLLALCNSDLIETNRPMPDSLKNSPLVATYMAYAATQRVGNHMKIIKAAAFSAYKAWKCPSINGQESLRERLLDVLCAIGPQLTASVYKIQIEGVVYSKNGRRGLFERLFDNEKNPEVLNTFRAFVRRFKRSPG